MDALNLAAWTRYRRCRPH